eukprot:scaffold62604_cov68-Phaeocystis_antarctica.AAC.1
MQGNDKSAELQWRYDRSCSGPQRGTAGSLKRLSRRHRRSCAESAPESPEGIGPRATDSACHRRASRQTRRSASQTPGA